MIKAVLLSDIQENSLSLLTKEQSKLMLPVVNKPFLEYLLVFLKRWGIEELFICHDDDHDSLYRYFNDGQGYGLRIHYHQQRFTPCTASFLKSISGSHNSDSFLVIDGGLFLDFNLSKFIEFHKTKNALATIAAFSNKNDNKDNSRLFELDISDDNKIQRFRFSNSSIEKRRSLRASGVYLFQPSIRSYIKSNSYFDINEQLLPLFMQENLPIYAYEIDGYCKDMGETFDYFELNRDVLTKDLGYLQDNNGERIWRGKNTKISESAFLLGPIVIGNDCLIEEGSKIIGPSVIGHRCQICQNVLLRESIIWDGTLLSEGTVAEYSIVAGGKHNPEPHFYRNAIVLSDRVNVLEVGLINRDFNMHYVFERKTSVILKKIKLKAYEIFKQLFDFTTSLILLILFAPLFLLISLLIKADSAGPALFRQKRCGKGGKEFNMIKFRTMFADAEDKKEKLMHMNECDGPMFKITKDPRVTKVGNFLRKACLDEVPQLINVVKGEMSLVGPRPLASEEMRYCPSWENNRLTVKPGITGLWQISKSNRNSFSRWIECDNYYVANLSLWLDLKILFKTMLKVANIR